MLNLGALLNRLAIYLIGIFFPRDGAPGRLGRINRSTPFLNSAFAFEPTSVLHFFAMEQLP